ncbi:MAG TPA: Crp/Fnr family transcriptional regulator [Fulvivirga sp.]|nr:Crp/Fnr family transcriptional regulator [Fulvivirga sp.]
MIPEETLLHYGGRCTVYGRGELLFHQHKKATYYFQVKSGEVKMAHYNADGQEFIQGIFGPGQSFGEPAIFGGFTYPCGAEATVESEVYKLPVESFFKLLEENFEIHKNFNRELSQRLRYKGMILNEISSYPPAHRIQTVLNYLRKRYGSEEEQFEVPLTRQQIADMTGLRVETVIKTIKKMALDRTLKIENRKVILE